MYVASIFSLWKWNKYDKVLDFKKKKKTMTQKWLGPAQVMSPRIQTEMTRTKRIQPWIPTPSNCIWFLSTSPWRGSRCHPLLPLDVTRLQRATRKFRPCMMPCSNTSRASAVMICKSGGKKCKYCQNSPYLAMKTMAYTLRTRSNKLKTKQNQAQHKKLRQQQQKQLREGAGANVLSNVAKRGTQMESRSLVFFYTSFLWQVTLWIVVKELETHTNY